LILDETAPHSALKKKILERVATLLRGSEDIEERRERMITAMCASFTLASLSMRWKQRWHGQGIMPPLR
jgi:hypothetical protein